MSTSARGTVAPTADDIARKPWDIEQYDTKDKLYAIPKRYEDTKPAQNQVFAHKNILDIGEQIRQKVETISLHKKEEALTIHEQEVWNRAVAFRDECVADALKDAKRLEEHRIAELKKEHEKHLKGELEKLQNLMEHECTKQVYNERRAGQDIKAAGLEQLGHELEIVKNEAVAEARAEENYIAITNSEEREREYNRQTDQLIEKLKKENDNELNDQKNKLADIEKENIKLARLEELEIAAQKISQVERGYELQLGSLRSTIQELIEKQTQILNDLDDMTKEKDYYLKKYNELHNQFTTFIEECRSDFSKGQSDFLMPTMPQKVDVLHDDQCSS